MEDWIGITLRFGLYGLLLILFGLAAYPVHADSAARPGIPGRAIAVLALAALAVSLGAFLQTVAAMSGTGIAGIDRETLTFVLGETDAGRAFAVRSLALALVAAAVWRGRSPPLWIGLSAVALATLGWSGHAAVTEGTGGHLHRLLDILHLLAAGVWLGALVMLGRRLAGPLVEDDAAEAAVGALNAFATTGTIVVVTIVLTGAANLVFITGSDMGQLATTRYGQLLGAKLLLFMLMLGLAAANRWRLTPRLAAARENGDRIGAQRMLRLSLALETAAAIAILLLVAWLGTLDPFSAV